MELETKRLLLTHWKESDAEALYEMAKEVEVGPWCGWNPHKDTAESIFIINNVFDGKYCFCLVDKGTGKPVGNIEILQMGHKKIAEVDSDECEIGFWIGKEYWGKEYIVEAGKEVLRFCFEDLGMKTVYAGYYDGNQKSKRAQEKLGFKYLRTDDNVYLPLLKEYRTQHFNILTKEEWMANNHE